MRKDRFKKVSNLNQTLTGHKKDAVILLPIQQGFNNPAILV